MTQKGELSRVIARAEKTMMVLAREVAMRCSPEGSDLLRLAMALLSEASDMVDQLPEEAGDNEREAES